MYTQCTRGALHVVYCGVCIARGASGACLGLRASSSHVELPEVADVAQDDCGLEQHCRAE